MAKNWVKIKTVNDVVDSMESRKIDRNMNHLIDITPSLSLDNLKKEQDLLYKNEKIKEDNLIAAYKDKKLKSKRLIKKAESIIAARKRAKLRQQEKDSKNES